MILTKVILTDNNNSFRKKGYKGEKIELLVEDLPNRSTQLVRCKCDYCELEFEIEYYKYFLKTKGINKKFACSKNCIKLKREETSMIKYGHTNVMLIDEFKEKLKTTNQKKWGFDNYSKTDEWREQVIKTSLEKWGKFHFSQTQQWLQLVKKTNLNNFGVEFPLQSEDCKQKFKKTNLQRYGSESYTKTNDYLEKTKKTFQEKWNVEHPMKLDYIIQKVKNTNIQKYGVDSYSKTAEFKLKSRDTNLKKYGVDHPMKSESFLKKQRETFNSKYGCDTIHQNEDFRKSNFIISSHPNYIKYSKNSISFFNCDCGENHQFEIHIDNFLKRQKSDLPLCTICYPIDQNTSIQENLLHDFISSEYSGEIIRSYRDQFELDIYLPDLKIGFEFNGLFWHSEKYRDRNYHLTKLIHFRNLGIRVYNIWEDDWKINKNIIKSQIRYILGKLNRIYARNCSVKVVNDVSIVKEFLNKNHIQGWVSSKLKIGLYHDEQLVSIMCFDQSEGRKKMIDGEWNLCRFCTEIDYCVVGGASKLFSYFHEHYKPNRVVSYSDNDWSVGNLYLELGFKKIKELKPDYKYLVDERRKHKSNFRKSYTKINESELEYPRIWDCGKSKYEKIF